MAERQRIGDSPVVTAMRVVPVAGRDSMLLNLSGAHGPFFTRNVVVMEDSAGHTGLGEVPGGEPIRKTLEDAIPLVVGQPVAAWNAVLKAAGDAFADRDSGGRVITSYSIHYTKLYEPTTTSSGVGVMSQVSATGIFAARSLRNNFV